MSEKIARLEAAATMHRRAVTAYTRATTAGVPANWCELAAAVDRAREEAQAAADDIEASS